MSNANDPKCVQCGRKFCGYGSVKHSPESPKDPDASTPEVYDPKLHNNPKLAGAVIVSKRRGKKLTAKTVKRTPRGSIKRTAKIGTTPTLPTYEESRKIPEGME